MGARHIWHARGSTGVSRAIDGTAPPHAAEKALDRRRYRFLVYMTDGVPAGGGTSKSISMWGRSTPDSSRQQRLYFLHDSHGQGSLRPTWP